MVSHSFQKTWGKSETTCPWNGTAESGGTHSPSGPPDRARQATSCGLKYHEPSSTYKKFKFCQLVEIEFIHGLSTRGCWGWSEGRSAVEIRRQRSRVNPYQL